MKIDDVINLYGAFILIQSLKFRQIYCFWVFAIFMPFLAYKFYFNFSISKTVTIKNFLIR